MPASSRYSWASSRSPTKSMTSYSPGANKMHIVKRLVVVGKAEREMDGKADGASVKMYLRLAISTKDASPGSSIALFPEDNLKILDSKVHPLTSTYAPYNFSTREHPILEKAAKALNLPSRSRESYASLFRSADSNISSPSSPGKLDAAAELGRRYAGEILVNDYHVCYVLPKEFPKRGNSDGGSPSRRSSELQFMAAIDIWVPYLSKPPSSPYLLSMPVPRCLSNYLKLRIFPPSLLTASMASLSSSDSEPTSWDLTSEPPVTRTTRTKLTRNSSTQSFADDESSDSASTTGFGEAYGLQGSFPSTERLQVRWAAPMRGDVPETSDGRRRVGIRDVRSDMSCSVLERTKSQSRRRDGGVDRGVVVRVEYTATCRGVWFPGVATMLGLDVALDAGDSEVVWAPEGEQKWTVSGGAGFTGFAVGPPPRTSGTAPPVRISPSSPSRHGLRENGEVKGGSASLLRAPLPEVSLTGDVSFDEASSPQTSPMSSNASLTTIPSSPGGSRRASSFANEGQLTGPDASSDDESSRRSPRVPITVHLNMNELGPPSKNEFTFTISGTILVKSDNALSPSPPGSASSSDSDTETESSILPLPQFHVLYSDRESLSTIILNETESSSLDVFNSAGNITDAQSRKTVLQPGGKTKCGSDGARLAVRPLPSQRNLLRRNQSTESLRRPRTPSLIARKASSSSLYHDRASFSYTPTKPRRDGPLMIPSVTATVTPLCSDDALPSGYAVCISLPAPSDAESEWLEFGLAQPSSGSTDEKEAKQPPRVDVASASVEGVPVLFETSAAVKPDSKLPALGLTFDETSAKEWITWVKVHVGDVGGGRVEVVYIVRPEEGVRDEGNSRGWFGGKGKEKEKAKERVVLDVLLPSFSLPIGTMEVNVECHPDFVFDIKSNLTHQQSMTGVRRLLQYSLEEFFYPNLIVTVAHTTLAPSRTSLLTWRALGVLVCLMSTVIAAFAALEGRHLAAELAEAHQALESYSSMVRLPTDGLEPVTVTSMVTATPATTLTTTVTAVSTMYTASPKRSRTEEALESSESSTTLVTTPSIPSVSTAPEESLPTSLQTLTLSPPSPPTPTPTPSSETALSAVQDLPFLWPMRFDLPSIHIPDAARHTAVAVWRGVGFAWYILQKMLHYPMEPE